MTKLIMKTLFAQQRTQIIHIWATTPELLSAPYAYAWSHGVYPLFQDGDSSVPDRPHTNFAEQFTVSADLVDQVTKFLDEKWQEGAVPTFYQLESMFGGKSNRSALMSICRYAYLSDLFDDTAWNALLTPTEHPTEARSIIKVFDDSEIHIL